MPFKPDKHEEELIKLYREAFLNVVQTIQVKEARGQVTVFYKDQLKGIMSILQDLDDQTDKWIKKAIPEIYKDNQREVINLVNKIGMQKDIRPQFAQIHQRAIDAAAQNIGDNLRNALNFAGRRISDEYREISLAAAGAKLASGRSVAQMAQDLANRLNERGLPALKDKAGRTWSMETYTRMVARTTTRELGSIATQNTCAEFGCDYVYIPFHPLDKEDICSHYADKVYCISGNDPKYPKFTEEARPPFHPNCRHTLQPYVPAIRDMSDQEIEDLIKEAPEILNKLGFEIPKAPDRSKDPKEEKKPEPTPPKAPEFNLEEFRKEIRALPAAEKYKKVMEKAGEFINDKIEALFKPPEAARINIINSGEVYMNVEFPLMDGNIKRMLLYKDNEYLISEFNKIKDIKAQYDFLNKTKSEIMNLKDDGKLMRLVKAQNALAMSLQHQQAAARGITKEQIWEAIGKQKIKPDQLDKLTIKSDTNFRDQLFKDRMSDATEFLTNYIEPAAAPARGINLYKLRKGARAYASGNTINIAPDDKTGVFIHEAAHVMHDYNKDIEILVQEFFKDRTAGEELRNIYSWTTKEKGYKDHFINHYVGKVYEWEAGDPKGTEVVSMGLQYMFDDPVSFKRQDPEHFKLIYSIMRGLY